MVAPGKFHLMQCAAQVSLNLCSSWWTSFTQSVKETRKYGKDGKEALNHGLQPQAFIYLFICLFVCSKVASIFAIYIYMMYIYIFYFILLYNTVLVLPYINMNPPQVYTCF